METEEKPLSVAFEAKFPKKNYRYLPCSFALVLAGIKIALEEQEKEEIKGKMKK
jgi:hypothetical protein